MCKEKYLFFLFTVLLICFTNKLYAGDKDKSKDQVLDFEADVIEGERKSPDLFLNLDMNSAKLDTVIFLRKDFNDYHEVDAKRKPRYQSQRVKK